MTTPLWDDKTAEQLKTLRWLLAEVSALNSCSDFLGNARKCIDAARELRGWGEENEEDAFIERLVRDCIREREKR